jgi:ribosomal protein L37E
MLRLRCRGDGSRGREGTGLVTEVPLPRDVKFVLHEIGSKSDGFTDAGARKAAQDFVDRRRLLPRATHTIVVGGYDQDPRSLWDIPEARAFVRAFAAWVLSLGGPVPLDEWGADGPTIMLLALCTGIGRITGTDTATGKLIVEIGKRGAPPWPTFTCPTCERISYHPRDAAERFCAVCGFASPSA